MGRHRRRRPARAFVVPSLSVLVGLVGLIAVVGVPATGRGDAAQRASTPRPREVAVASTMTPSVPLAGTPFAGTPAVGALFVTDGQRLGRHFCTASVVDSPAGNLVITAAHCVTGPGHDARHLAFVPGLRDDVKPYGVWSVTRIIVDDTWSATADPDHDVAFLTVARDGGLARIQDFTGANRLGTGRPSGVVRVIGYPVDQGRPIGCQNRTGVFGGQQRFDCKDYRDGTSGGPFVTGAATGDGNGTVVGVVGGHEEGGLTPDISYSIVFGPETRALYDTAVARA
ncbi:trypsin-like serine peptidase [Actinomadura scrupuli]|uniref:trypsin-like serine peptidase n=1 Tax=Actinomadura scrupuli TaxID=559629 RepID=UPI003D9727FF